MRMKKAAAQRTQARTHKRDYYWQSIKQAILAVLADSFNDLLLVTYVWTCFTFSLFIRLAFVCIK